MELKEIGKAWKSDSQSIVRKPIFIFFTMKDMPDLLNALEAQWKKIREIRDLALDHGTKLTPEAMKDVGKMMHNVISAQNDRQVKAAKARKALEDSQKDDKMDQKTAENKIENLQEAFKKIGLSDVESADLVKLYEQERAKKGNGGSAAPKANAGDSSVVQEKVTNQDHILVVDWTNGDRAIMAQTYLELVRAWTANHGSRWLFHRVDSAGWKIDSWFRRNKGKLEGDELLPEGRSCFVQAIDALIDTLPDSLATDSWPNEKKAIAERVKEHKNRGIRKEDFTNCAWIICFDWTSCTKVQLLADLAQKAHPAQKNKACVVMLEGCPYIQSQSLAETANQLRKATDKFLIDERGLAWKRPAKSIDDGLYRTCWVSAKSSKERDAIGGANRENRNKIEALTKCKVRTSWHAKDLGWIVAITGPKELLANAESIVKATMAKAA